MNLRGKLRKMNNLPVPRARLYPAAILCLLVVLSQFSGTRSAHAIVIRDDADVSENNALAASYLAAGFIGFAGTDAQTCSCSLVAPNKILTAAHCVDFDADGEIDYDLSSGVLAFGVSPNIPVIDPPGEGSTGPRESEQGQPDLLIFFGGDVAVVDIFLGIGGGDRPDNASSGSSSNTIPIVSGVVHPEWDGDFFASEIHDLAVLTLERPLTGVTPLRLSGLDPTDQIVDMVGYGLQGFGSAFPADIAGANDKLAAENVLDFTDLFGGILESDFDNPDGSTSTYGDTSALPLEGTTAPGDSGGPLVVTLDGVSYLVGVLSGGYNPYGIPSEYGDISRWTWIGTESNATFLMEQGIIYAGDTNLDFDVDVDDLTTLLQNFTSAVGEVGGKTNLEGDTDGDGDVDTADFTRAMIMYTGALSIIGNNPDGGEEVIPGLPGETGPDPNADFVPRTNPVPEPASLLLLAIGAVGVVCGRRRRNRT